MWDTFVLGNQYLRLSYPGVSKNDFFCPWHSLHHLYTAKERMSVY